MSKVIKRSLVGLAVIGLLAAAQTSMAGTWGRHCQMVKVGGFKMRVCDGKRYHHYPRWRRWHPWGHHHSHRPWR